MAALTALPRMFFLGFGNLLLNNDPVGAAQIVGSFASAIGPGPIIGAFGVHGQVVFGHGARHLIGSGLSQEAVQGAIAGQVSQIAGISGEFWGRVLVSGQVVTYRAYPLNGGVINVGTYTLPKAGDLIRWVP